MGLFNIAIGARCIEIHDAARIMRFRHFGGESHIFHAFDDYDGRRYADDTRRYAFYDTSVALLRL